MRRLILILALLGLASGVASAATATVTLTYDGSGNFDVKVALSGVSTDPNNLNHGLALYKIPLTGYDTLSNMGPMGAGITVPFVMGTAYGFTTFRSGADVSPLAASQDLAAQGQPDIIIYGFGITGGTLPASVLGHVQQTYGAPLLVGEGTYSGDAPDFNVSAENILRLIVLTSSDGLGVREMEEAQGDTINLVVIPEPATMGLLAIGGIGVLLRRRRRA